MGKFTAKKKTKSPFPKADGLGSDTAEPEEHKFSKRLFGWLKDQKPRIISHDEIGVVSESHPIASKDESIVWEKETIKKGPAYKLVSVTKLVRLSDYELAVESEQKANKELTELDDNAKSADWSQIKGNLRDNLSASIRKIPTKDTKGTQSMEYTRLRPLPNVIKANPYIASANNLIPLASSAPAPAPSADELMRQEYEQNRDKPGYITPVSYNLDGYEDALIGDEALVE